MACRKSPDLVTGEPEDCRIVRKDETKCGPAGAWFIDREQNNTSDAIETPKATIRRETDRPWEKDGKKDYE